MSAPVFIVNFKNYSRVLGGGAVELSLAAEKVSSETGVQVIVAPPVPTLALVAGRVKIGVFSQKVETADEGKSTGSVIPEAVKAAGCAGSLLNHSESRVGLEGVVKILPKMKALSLQTCVCAESVEEMARMAALAPEYIAIEPPELIGSGTAVSRARPELIEDSVAAAADARFRGRTLCGAGIVSGEDARAARRLGTDGILVASSVVKAEDWGAKLLELASALLD